jgi:hypothetical protein
MRGDPVNLCVTNTDGAVELLDRTVAGSHDRDRLKGADPGP